ncbi:GNAT family N-acetyltransferase [Sediminibacillus albus]|uniref:Protein N-acetyltransferase, RimJ/RimL family n=1 Tax=Sediminibacillus albus TaxID=407036 RepID=A0A1G9B7I0_9BACI|nr:GNAT family N-acetyltransferase [Sediminibacillus albus]SDK35459.1 Protein N-acetyltransferase, RimJ/RimL family [Sediminibacillus albus]
METVISSERLRMRRMNQKDKSNLLKIFSDPVAMAYYPSTKNEEETEQWIQWTLDNYRKYKVGLWVVEDKLTGDFLGMCGLVPQKIDGKVEMEIGYLFERAKWGKGYATEAAQACKDYGLGYLKCRELFSLIDPGNLPSIKVARRVGMDYFKTIIKWDKEIAIYKVKNKD